MDSSQSTCHRVFSAVAGSALLSTFCIPAGAGVVDGFAVDSQYGEALGAGGVSFELPQDQLFFGYGEITQIQDINNDGVIDLVFTHNTDIRVINYALGHALVDGSHGFTFYNVFSASNSYVAAGASDLDGNGWADVFYTSYSQDTVEIGWVEDGVVVNTTTENTGLLWSTSSSESDYLDARLTIRAGDLDGDGQAELVFNTLNSNVVVRWSSREAGSEYSTYPTPSVTGEPVLFELQDYDGDGALDVLVMDMDDEEFVLLAGAGLDSLSLARTVSVPASGFVDEVAYPIFGEFDGLAGVDLVIFDQPSGQTLLVPSFTEGVIPPSVLPLIGDERAEIRLDDIDSSGFDDLLISGTDPLSNDLGDAIQDKWLLLDPLSIESERVLIETGNTESTVQRFISSATPLRISECIVLDLNGDGLKDFLWTSEIRENKISDISLFGYIRSFTIRASPQRDVDSGLPIFGATQLEGQKSPLHTLPYDFDDDGVDELLGVGNVTRARIVDVNDGGFENVAGLNNGFMSAVADFGGNGENQIVVTRVFGGLVVRPLMTDGSLGAPVSYPDPDGNQYLGVMIADFDNDGKDDLVAVNSSSRAYIYGGVDNTTITLDQLLQLPNNRTVLPGVLDLNQDGFLDLVFGKNNGFVTYLNDQTGQFVQGQELGALVEPYWILAMDMDLDGNVDLVSANGSSSSDGVTLSAHYLDSAGMIEKTVYFFDFSDTSIFEVIVEDFTGDGLPDIMGSYTAGQSGSATVNRHQVWAQAEGRTFNNIAVLPAPTSSTIAMSDLNLDGAMDVITASDLDDSVRVHWGTPAGCSADLNGDGDLNFLDISLLLSDRPDFNGDGGFNFLDISAYLAAFGAGCP